MAVIRTINMSLKMICLGIKRRMDYTGVVVLLVVAMVTRNLDL